MVEVVRGDLPDDVGAAEMVQVGQSERVLHLLARGHDGVRAFDGTADGSNWKQSDLAFDSGAVALDATFSYPGGQLVLVALTCPSEALGLEDNCMAGARLMAFTAEGAGWKRSGDLALPLLATSAPGLLAGSGRAPRIPIVTPAQHAASEVSWITAEGALSDGKRLEFEPDAICPTVAGWELSSAPPEAPRPDPPAGDQPGEGGPADRTPVSPVPLATSTIARWSTGADLNQARLAGVVPNVTQ